MSYDRITSSWSRERAEPFVSFFFNYNYQLGLLINVVIKKNHMSH